MNAAPQLRVALRADASAGIGLGHVQRCLALAQALRQCGAQVSLVTRGAGDAAARSARQAGVPCIDLSPGDDAEASAAALRAFAPHWVVVDHYGLDAGWHRAVAGALGCRIAAIDDLGDRPIAADVLIDHNHAADHARKYAAQLAGPTRLLVGPRYALLGPAYATAPRHTVGERVRSLGLFLGGTDPAGLSGVVLRACREHAGFAGAIEVVTTSANPRLGALASACAADGAATLTVDAPDLAGFFARHDLQVGAGGGATWERCCIGAPTVVLACAANQQAVIPALLEAGAAVAPEPFDSLEPAAIGRAVAALAGDAAARQRIATRARALVDGRGAQRVALALNAAALRVRPAQPEDSALAHAWRNHPTTRQASVDGAEIAWPAHQRWWQASLGDATRRLLIGCVGELPVGVVRLDRQADGAALVSVYLDPALHGLGLGGALLREGERAWEAETGRPAVFVATVLDGNLPSQRLFAAAGYVREAARHWRKTPAAAGARTTR